MIEKQVSALGKSKKLEFCFSMQLNKNLFSIRRYCFPWFSAKSVSLNMPDNKPGYIEPKISIFMCFFF